MSQISNFVAANKKSDMVPAPLARSILSLTRSIRKRLSEIGLSALIADYKAHVNNFSNPHKDNVGEFSSELPVLMYSMYLQLFTSDPTQTGTPLSAEAFATWISDPIVFVEVCRRLSLDSYKYDDGVGNVTTPIYGLGDISPDVPPPAPSYFVGYSMPDMFAKPFVSDGSLLVKELPTQSSKMTVGVSVTAPAVPDLTKTYTYTAMVTNAYSDGILVNFTVPGDPTTGPNGIQAQALSLGTSPESAVISTGSDFIQSGVLNFWPFTAATTEASVVLAIDGGVMSIYYVLETLIQKVTVTIPESMFSRPLDRIVMSPTWDQKVSGVGGIKSLMVYPQTFSDSEVGTLFERL